MLSTHIFYDDLFIIAITYKDTSERLHSLICISDIEKSLDRSSDTHLSMDTLFQIIMDTLLQYTIGLVTYDAIYLFSGQYCALGYDAIYHYGIEITNV